MTPTSRADLTPAQRLRSIFSGSVGNLVEWYDWYVYAAFSLYFAEVFFPGGDRTSQLLKTATIFAVGFLMRPLGGWLLGRYADRHGRRAALLLSVWMMCAGSLVIAFTPGYASIGVAAPVLLVLARLLQGLSVGGEYGTSATYLSEMAGREHRGFWSSFQYVTLVMGHLVALAVLLALQPLLTPEQLREWGWRIPFAIGALAAVAALWLRRNMAETESFARSEADASAAQQRHQGTLRVLLQHPRALLPRRVLLEDFELAGESQLQREVARDPREKSVQRAEAEQVHRVRHVTQKLKKILRAQAGRPDLARQPLGRRRVRGRPGQLVEDLVEKFSGGLAREGERNDPLRTRPERQQPHEAIRELIGFSGSRGGEDHHVADPGRHGFHGASSFHATLAAAPW